MQADCCKRFGGGEPPSEDKGRRQETAGEAGPGS